MITFNSNAIIGVYGYKRMLHLMGQ